MCQFLYEIPFSIFRCFQVEINSNFHRVACPAHVLFVFWLPHLAFRSLRALSTCFSAALIVSPITSEISQTSSFPARSSVCLSRSISGFVSLKLVSDSTISAKSKAEPDANSFMLSMVRYFQFWLFRMPSLGGLAISGSQTSLATV